MVALEEDGDLPEVVGWASGNYTAVEWAEFKREQRVLFDQHNKEEGPCTLFASWELCTYGMIFEYLDLP